MHQSSYSLGWDNLGVATPPNGNATNHSDNKGGQYFDFNTRLQATVSVENIPEHVDRHEVLALFNTLIGEIRSFQPSKSQGLEITFSNRDTAVKALCMNGYNVSGTSLAVKSVGTNNLGCRQVRVMDDRRNLYVLGLPFALTKTEFTALFSKYGTVSHSVILATVDNSSRRRGFVVMSSHEEAKQAMSALTRTQIKGHTIDVSWAVVQRSQGFLDGGDRAMLLDSRTHLPNTSPKLFDRTSLPMTNGSDSSGEPQASDLSVLSTSPCPTGLLVVANLPTLLFSQAQDLHPLFAPFGQVDKLEIVQVSALGTMTVTVQYSTISAAQEAKESLHGQVYGSFRLDARFAKHPSDGGASSPVVDTVNGLDTVNQGNTQSPSMPGYLSGFSRDLLHNGLRQESRTTERAPTPAFVSRPTHSRQGSSAKDLSRPGSGMSSALPRPYTSAHPYACPEDRVFGTSRWPTPTLEPINNYPYQTSRLSAQCCNSVYQKSTA